MSVAALNRTRRGARAPSAALLLFALSIAIFAGTALATGDTAQLSWGGIVGLVQRMVGLGLVAIGQTFAILVGSIDLSVANLISVSAVMASYVMQGDPGMIAPAVAAVLGIAVVVGLANGAMVAFVGVNPLIATLGMGLILQGLLSASFNNFAGSVPTEFQIVAYGEIFGLPISALALFALALIAGATLSETKFGAHLYAVGGDREGARLAGVRTGRVILGAHVIASVAAGLTGLYLAARLRSGAPWVGREGVYDLESIAVVVIGGTLLAGGRGGVWGTLAGALLFASLDAAFNMLGVEAFLKQVLRGAIVVAAVAVYAVRMRGHAA